jgi:hypothetical protein
MLFDILKTATSPVTGIAKTVIGSASGIVGDIVKPVVDAGVKLGTGVVNKAGDVIDKGVHIAEKAANTGIDTFGGIGKALSSPFVLIGIAILGVVVLTKLK